MRAVVCRELGPPSSLVVEDRPVPEPGPGEVRVAVAAAGVNFADSLVVQGRYQIRPPLPFVPGMEVAGTVDALGDAIEGLAVGDRVATMSMTGGYAEQVVVRADLVAHLPDEVDFERAASMLQAYGTTMFALELRGNLRAGETLLVLGAGGGVGLAAIDVGQALGARVIAAASTAEKLVQAIAMGAEATIDYSSEELKSRARELSGHGGVDVVYDPVGGELAEPALRALREFGRYLVIGFAAGDIPLLPANQILLRNRAVVGVEWGAWAITHLTESRELLDRGLAMTAGGKLHPVAPAVRPLEDARRVLEDLQARRVVGKIVLVP